MAVVLKARLVCRERLEKRLALDELKVRDIPTVEMQEIESVIDEPSAPLAISRRLRMGEARQSGIIDATEFPVDVGGLDIWIRERCNGAWIFLSPVESGASQASRTPLSMRAAMRKPSSFDFVQPFRAGRRLLDGPGKTNAVKFAARAAWWPCGDDRNAAAQRSGLPCRRGRQRLAATANSYTDFRLALRENAARCVTICILGAGDRWKGDLTSFISGVGPRRFAAVVTESRTAMTADQEKDRGQASNEECGPAQDKESQSA